MSRFWIGTQLCDQPESREIEAIVKTWKKLRCAPQSFSQAIRLYDALANGDLSGFLALLAIYFPGMALAGLLAHNSLPVASRVLAAPKLESRTMTTEEIENEALSALDELW